MFWGYLRGHRLLLLLATQVALERLDSFLTLGFMRISNIVGISWRGDVIQAIRRRERALSL